MPKFEYTPDISLGNILQIIAFLVAITASYVSLANRDVQHDERISNNTNELIRIEKKVDFYSYNTNAELEKLDKNMKIMDEKFIRSIIRNLEQELEIRKNANNSRTR